MNQLQWLAMQFLKCYYGYIERYISSNELQMFSAQLTCSAQLVCSKVKVHSMNHPSTSRTYYKWQSLVEQNN